LEYKNFDFFLFYLLFCFIQSPCISSTIKLSRKSDLQQYQTINVANTLYCCHNHNLLWHTAILHLVSYLSLYYIQRRECLSVRAVRIHKYRIRKALDMKLTWKSTSRWEQEVRINAKKKNLERNWGGGASGWQRNGEACLLSDQHKETMKKEYSSAGSTGAPADGAIHTTYYLEHTHSVHTFREVGCNNSRVKRKKTIV